MEYNLLVHYFQDVGYLSARREIERHLISLGDKKALIEKSRDGSVVGVRTVLEPKELIQELKEKFVQNPSEFSSTEKWIPVETWCAAGVENIKKAVSGMIEQINNNDRWSAEVETWGRGPFVEEILQILKHIISARFVEVSSSKIVFVEFQGSEAAISILKPDDIFLVVRV
ncbi:hypothetical protein HY484_01740 [Candidatus Woesearchaeota archaeon]|nr:hypothetical protein [Candidatus Woesearchaeota archaeon]